MVARYEGGISIAEVSERWPRMLPEQFPQIREVALPELGDGVVALVELKCDGAVVRANAYGWLPLGRADHMVDFVPTRSDDRLAQERALELI